MVNTATTLGQYSGLNCSAVSTMINRSGRAGSIEFMVREMFRTEADSLEVELEDSAGM